MSRCSSFSFLFSCCAIIETSSSGAVATCKGCEFTGRHAHRRDLHLKGHTGSFVGIVRGFVNTHETRKRLAGTFVFSLTLCWRRLSSRRKLRNLWLSKIGWNLRRIRGISQPPPIEELLDGDFYFGGKLDKDNSKWRSLNKFWNVAGLKMMMWIN